MISTKPGDTTDEDRERIEPVPVTRDGSPDLDDETPDTAVDELVVSVREMTTEVTEGKIIKFPQEIFEQVQALKEQVIEMGKKNSLTGSKRWIKTIEEAKIICRLFALGYEYSATMGSITKEIPVAASDARRLMDNNKISNLTDLESAALNLMLTSASDLPQKDANGRRKRFSENMKKMVVAIARLLRKKELNTNEFHTFIVAANITVLNIVQWEGKFMENGLLVSTSNLVPDFFEQANKLLKSAKVPDEQTLSAGSDTEKPEIGIEEEPEEKLEEEPIIRIDEKVFPNVNAKQEVREDAPPTQSTNLRIIEELTGQNGDFLRAVIGNPALLQSPAMTELLKLNRAMFEFVINGTNNTQKSPAAEIPLPPLSISSGEMHLSPETLALIRTGEIVVRATTTEIVVSGREGVKVS